MGQEVAVLVNLQRWIGKAHKTLSWALGLPWCLLKDAQRLARHGAGDESRVAVDTLGVAQQFDAGLTERMAAKPP